MASLRDLAAWVDTALEELDDSLRIKSFPCDANAPEDLKRLVSEQLPQTDPGVFLADAPQEIRDFMHYRSTLFKRDSIERFVDSFTICVRRLSENPEARVDAIRHECAHPLTG